MKFTILVTRACNLKCRYCYCSKEENTHMNLNTAKKIVDYIKTFHTDHLSIDFLGGEPLINFDVIKYITNELKSAFDSISFFITTNGTIFSREVFDFMLLENKFVISFSIDGDKEVHDKNRIYKNGNPTYADIIANIKTIKSNYDTELRIRGTITPDNVNNLFENYKDLYDNFSKYTVFLPDYYNSVWNHSNLETYREEYVKIFFYIKEKDLLFFDEIFKQFIETNFSKMSTCDMGLDNLKIDYDGSIYPCQIAVGKEEFKTGDVMNGLSKSILDEFNIINETDNTVCTACKRYDHCITKRCKIINKLCTDDYFTPSTIMCNVLNEHYKIILSTMNQTA